MQMPYIQSTDPRYQLDRAVRAAAQDYIDEKITTAELLRIVSKLKAVTHV